MSADADAGPRLPPAGPPPPGARAEEEVPLPPPRPSRRALAPAQRAALALATHLGQHRMTILQSEPLLRALQSALDARDLAPEELVRDLLAEGPPDPAAPVDALIRRLDAHPDLDLWSRSAGAPRTVEPVPLDASPSTPSAPPTAPVVRPGGYVPRHRISVAQRTLASRGWRATVRRGSGGAVRLGPSRDEKVEATLVERVQAPIDGYRHVVVLSLKGGSGKTTTTVMLGHTFATHRRDRVAAIDASPDAGTLAYRIAEQPTTSVRTLLDAADAMRRYVDVRPLAGHTSSRLDLVASDADPGVSRAFGSADYRRAADILTRFYSLVLTDCGAGLMHDTMGSILDSADQLVLVMTPAVDGVRSADLTLDWLDAHGYSDLVLGGVAVVNSVEPRPVLDVPEIVAHFAERCRAVVEVPRDPHLAEGAATDLAALARDTRRSYLSLAAAVADGFEDRSVRRGRMT